LKEQGCLSVGRKGFGFISDQAAQSLQSGQDGSERERGSHGHAQDDAQARDDS
jgi:hypothetical protein